MYSLILSVGPPCEITLYSIAHNLGLRVKTGKGFIKVLEQQKYSDGLEKCLNTRISAPIGSKKCHLLLHRHRCDEIDPTSKTELEDCQALFRDLSDTNSCPIGRGGSPVRGCSRSMKASSVLLVSGHGLDREREDAGRSSSRCSESMSETAGSIPKSLPTARPRCSRTLFGDAWVPKAFSTRMEGKGGGGRSTESKRSGVSPYVA